RSAGVRGDREVRPAVPRRSAGRARYRTLDRLPENGRVAHPAIRIERIAGDYANGVPADSLVEARCVASRHGVEDEQRLSLGARLPLELLHQPMREPTPSCGTM